MLNRKFRFASCPESFTLVLPFASLLAGTRLSKSGSSIHLTRSDESGFSEPSIPKHLTSGTACRSGAELLILKAAQLELVLVLPVVLCVMLTSVRGSLRVYRHWISIS